MPVLILSAKASVDDRVTGLQTGGDDYLPKPFAFAELLARAQVWRRPNEMSFNEGGVTQRSRSGTPLPSA
ncbi:MAG: hypothetical protein ACR2ID_08675 [Chthoniobacterales bacterium]